LKYYPSFVKEMVEITSSTIQNETLSQIVWSVLVGFMFTIIVAAFYIILTMARTK
jgi:hypothetical protein